MDDPIPIIIDENYMTTIKHWVKPDHPEERHNRWRNKLPDSCWKCLWFDWCRPSKQKCGGTFEHPPR